MKTVAQATARYLAGAASPAAQTAWAADFIAAIPTMQSRAKAKVSFWQFQVSQPSAAVAYTAGIDKMNVSQVSTKVNGAGKASYSAGVTAAGQSNGNYSLAAAKLNQFNQTAVPQLDTTNPRGTFQENIARAAAYATALHAAKGTLGAR
jgi:protein involved in ribonucleotide reduction